MTIETPPQAAFVPIRQAAHRLGVPATWLRTEALAGRLPHLRVGRRLLVDPEAVRAALVLRAVEEGRKGVGHAD
jgi:excisionase family DNA binding protein